MNFKIRENEENIRLGQLLKATGLVDTGSEAKIVIQNGEVKVNGDVCLMRGKKIVRGDNISFSGKDVEVS